MKHLDLGSPRLTVEDVVFELRRLSGLCGMMMWYRSTDEIHPEDVAATMIVIRELVDEQIEVLNGIDWFKEKTVSA